jgi:hypothetical protein
MRFSFQPDRADALRGEESCAGLSGSVRQEIVTRRKRQVRAERQFKIRRIVDFQAVVTSDGMEPNHIG